MGQGIRRVIAACRVYFARALGVAAVGAAAIAGMAMATAAEPLGTVRVGVLEFGTVNWELDTMLHHGLAEAEGVDLEVVTLANNDATKVALQSGAVDMIVTDWPWVSRQRADGADFTFIPYSLTVGALMVPADSMIEDVGHLAGKRLGIVGGPLDKSWLLLRALAGDEYGVDLEADTDKAFGAPPLLFEEIKAGRLDAVLTYWHYAARLEAEGYRRVIDVQDVVRALGVEADPPMLGYAFREGWAAENAELVRAFAEASREAKALLSQSDEEWRRLAPLTRAENDAVLAALRDGYRAGVPQHWGETERAAATRLFAILAELGGEELVGPSLQLEPGTFWGGVSY
jgi:NitT/TauT family transport system substrate-binding protein